MHQNAAQAQEQMWSGTSKWLRERELLEQMLEFIKRRRSEPVTGFRAPLKQMETVPGRKK